MDWTHLYSMQKQLDLYIEKNQGLGGNDLVEEKTLALLVEIGELANETRCFKFWSVKPKSSDDVILAEYVDGLHFILSLGLDQGFRYESYEEEKLGETLSNQFNLVFDAIIAFRQCPTSDRYNKMFAHFLQLGNSLGFSEKAICEAYIKKNEINFERQNNGY